MLYNKECEAGILGVIVNKPDMSIPTCKLKPITVDMFSFKHHAVIYKLLLKMDDAGKPIDLITVTSELSKHPEYKTLEEIISDALLNSFDFNLEYYIDEVYNASIARKGLQAYDKAVKDLKHADSPVDVFTRVEGEISTLVRDGVIERNVDEVNKSIIESWDMDGLLSRHLEMNVIMRYDGMVVLGGRPSCGKTAHALDETAYWCDDRGLTVCGASLEMSEEKIRERMAGRLAGVNTFKLWRGDGSKDDRKKVINALEHMKSWKLHISDKPMTCEQFCAWAKSMKSMYNPDVIWVDYLQLLKSSDFDWKIQPEQRIARWSNMIKETQKQIGIPMLVLSQLSRGDGSAPTLASLRYSGAIEQDADVVIFVYKDPDMDAGDFRGDAPWPEYLDVQKQRNGGVDRVGMLFDREFQRFLPSKKLDITDPIPDTPEELDWN